MESDHKLRVLALIAEKLNSARVVYAGGASAMLFLRGVVDTFHDVDLLIAEPDAARAAAVLRSLGTMAPQERHSDYPTHIFQEYTIDGVEVDLIAGMMEKSFDLFTATHGKKAEEAEGEADAAKEAESEDQETSEAETEEETVEGDALLLDAAMQEEKEESHD